MKTIDVIRELIDETPILSQISKDLPFPYITIINQKIKEFGSYLEEIHTLELEKNKVDLQNYSNVLTSQTKETETIEAVKENFFGEIIETHTYNNPNKEVNFLDEIVKKLEK